MHLERNNKSEKEKITSRPDTYFDEDVLGVLGGTAGFVEVPQEAARQGLATQHIRVFVKILLGHI